MTANTEKEISLKITEALPKDVGRAFARIDPEDMQRIQAALGDIIEVTGKRTTYCKVMPIYQELRGQARIQIDGVSRENAKAGLDDLVQIRKTACPAAERVDLTPLTFSPSKNDARYIASLLDGLPVVQGDRVRVALFGNKALEFKVERTSPQGPVIFTSSSKLATGKRQEEKAEGVLSYEDVGGLRQQLQRIRETIELPLRYPELFERLGIEAPKGVLLHGPPGCGKTLIARAIAHETEARFFSINGPEVIHKFYGESEAHLRKVFEQAGKSAPSIIFIDEIDAIAPKREKVVGDVEKRVVAQLLGLMDGLARQLNVMVIAATNIPNALDPALRRPGRFDREIQISIPDRIGRREILDIHSRGMPLHEEVDLEHVAEITHGFVGADLQALCREAAMVCLRGFMPEIDFSLSHLSGEHLLGLQVRMDDFISALREIEPSAIREVFVDVPDVGWQDVGGLAQAKTHLIEAVEWPLKYPHLFEQAGTKPPKGLLIAGPPGCGKTMLAKAVANESQVNFIAVKGPALLSKYVGESEQGIREVFQKARQAAPCLVFFDEIDALLPMRGSGSETQVTERVLSQFLVEFDGIEELKGVFVLGASNRKDLLDPAVLRPGRFDEILEIPLPDAASRKDIFSVHLRNKPVVRDIDLEALTNQSQGLSGADIASVCNRASLQVVRQAVAKGGQLENMRIECEDLERIMQDLFKRGSS